MIPGSGMFYFTSAATIRQPLNILQTYVTKTLKIKTNRMDDTFIVVLNLKRWERNIRERRGGHKGTKGIKERKKGIKDEVTNDMVPQ
jgi:hypothetical protein